MSRLGELSSTASAPKNIGSVIGTIYSLECGVWRWDQNKASGDSCNGRQRSKRSKAARTALQVQKNGR